MKENENKNENKNENISNTTGKKFEEFSFDSIQSVPNKIETKAIVNETNQKQSNYPTGGFEDKFFDDAPFTPTLSPLTSGTTTDTSQAVESVTPKSEPKQSESDLNTFAFDSFSFEATQAPPKREIINSNEQQQQQHEKDNLPLSLAANNVNVENVFGKDDFSVSVTPSDVVNETTNDDIQHPTPTSIPKQMDSDSFEANFSNFSLPPITTTETKQHDEKPTTPITAPVTTPVTTVTTPVTTPVTAPVTTPKQTDSFEANFSNFSFSTTTEIKQEDTKPKQSSQPTTPITTPKRKDSFEANFSVPPITTTTEIKQENSKPKQSSQPTTPITTPKRKDSFEANFSNFSFAAPTTTTTAAAAAVMETKPESPFVATSHPKTEEGIKLAPTDSITIQNVSEPSTPVLKIDSRQPSSRSPDTSLSDVVSHTKESKSVEGSETF